MKVNGQKTWWVLCQKIWVCKGIDLRINMLMHSCVKLSSLFMILDVIRKGMPKIKSFLLHFERAFDKVNEEKSRWIYATWRCGWHDFDALQPPSLNLRKIWMLTQNNNINISTIHQRLVSLHSIFLCTIAMVPFATFVDSCICNIDLGLMKGQIV